MYRPMQIEVSAMRGPVPLTDLDTRIHPRRAYWDTAPPLAKPDLVPLGLFPPDLSLGFQGPSAKPGAARAHGEGLPQESP